jgi:antitoxin VapB
VALSIKHDEADRLARQLAKETGESLTDAVVTALRERLDRVRRPRRTARLREELRLLQERVSALPVLDARTPDRILGYGDDGQSR